MSNPEKCPSCGTPWFDEREIPVVLLEARKYKTIEEAEEAAAEHGWTKENKMRPAKDVCGLQYARNHREFYDGVSEWQCTKCWTRVGSWSGRILVESECEPRFGVKNG